MAFLENLGKKVGEAAQAAAKKSGDLVETTKISVSINQEEDKIQKLYAQIGKEVYTKYASTGTIFEGGLEACEAIRVHEQNIKGLKDKMFEIKGIKLCTGCGSEMEKAQIFCSKCGAKNEVPPTASVPAADQAKAGNTCPTCGSTVQQGSMFCMNCGSKVG